jgi:mono/diheme cytochrome c family protein
MHLSLGRLPLFSLLIVVMVLTAGAGAQAPAPSFTPSDEQPENFPEGAGREETFYTCTACHNFKLIAAQGMTRDRWDDTLTWMTSRHNMPDIQGADRQLILSYLERHYPPKPPRAGGWRSPFSQQ